MSLDFEQRCAIAAACLPKADYRTQLEKLHAEMLAALETARADAGRWQRLSRLAFTGAEWTEIHECLRLRATARFNAAIDAAMKDAP